MDFGTPPPATNFYNHDYVYGHAFILFTGIHMAAPNLTPTTFRDGLFAYPPSGGGVTEQRTSWGPAGKVWRWDDYAPYDDLTEQWWDADAFGPDENGRQGRGMYRWMNGGRRYLPGRWPESEPKVHDPAGTVLRSEQVPDHERWPEYKPKPRQ